MTYRSPVRTWSVRVHRLVREALAGLYRIPAFQRPFVWSDKDAAALLDSLAGGLWPGALLMWERHDLPTGPVAVPGGALTAEGKAYNFLVVDGQQRIGSLVRTLVAPGFSWLPDSGRFVPGEPESGVPLRWCMDKMALLGACRRSGIDAMMPAIDLLDRIESAEVTIVAAPHEWTLPEVMEQFRRMNTAGVRMDPADLEAGLARALEAA